MNGAIVRDGIGFCASTEIVGAVRHPPCAEAFGEQSLGAIGEFGSFDPRDRLFDGVFDPFDLDPAVLDDRVRGAGVAVARHAHASGIENDDVSNTNIELQMRMTDT